MSFRIIFTNAMLASALIAIASPASAQEKYPSRPIEMIIPVAPGGGVDVSFRALAEMVEQDLGKIVVINKPGASGTLGIGLVTQAKPDGYMIGGTANAPLTMAPHLVDAGFKPTDYVAAAMVTTAPMVMCAKKDFLANTGQELIDLFRKNPNTYTYGTDGVGGIVQVSFERVFAKLGVQARAIPFKGASETLAAFLGNHINLYGGTIALMQPHMANGSVKCLLLTSAERNAASPDAASLTDIGIPGEATANWRVVIAPKGIPADRLAMIEKAFVNAANSEKFKKFMSERGEEAKGASAVEAQKLLDSEYTALGDMLRAAGLAKKP